MENLKKLRIAGNFSQLDVANILNVTQTAYGRYENDKREAPYNILKQLAKMFDVSIDCLLDFKPNEPRTADLRLSAAPERMTANTVNLNGVDPKTAADIAHIVENLKTFEYVYVQCVKTYVDTVVKEIRKTPEIPFMGRQAAQAVDMDTFLSGNTRK